MIYNKINNQFNLNHKLKILNLKIMMKYFQIINKINKIIKKLLKYLKQNKMMFNKMNH